MKKTAFCCILLLALITAGACSSKTSAVKLEDNANFEAFKALDGGEWEKAIGLFESLTGEADAQAVSYIGLARAQIGAGKLEDARETLNRIADQDQENALFYLAEVNCRLEDYSSASDCYYRLMELEPENKTVKDRLCETMWKTKDYGRIYEIAFAMFRQEPENIRYLNQLLKACAILEEGSRSGEVLEALKDTEYYQVVKALTDAFEERKNGNIEGARSLLFDIGKVNLYEKAGSLYYGEYDENGIANGFGVSVQKVFGNPGVMIGNWKNGLWEGECAAWFGMESTATRTVNGIRTEGIHYTMQEYKGIWKEGVPHGKVTESIEYWSVFEGQENRGGHSYEETVLQMVNGMAHGRTVTAYYYERNGERRLSGETIHEFKDGKPQPFSAMTQDGERMVYETQADENGEIYHYEEQDCGCEYIWG